MKLFLPTLLVAVTATLGAQPSRSQGDGLVYVRAISVADGNHLLPGLSFETVQNAWKESSVGLSAELKTTPESLDEIASRADKVLQRIYGDAAQPVLVEHEIDTMSPSMPRYVEVRFRVTPAASPK